MLSLVFGHLRAACFRESVIMSFLCVLTMEEWCSRFCMPLPKNNTSLGCNAHSKA